MKISSTRNPQNYNKTGTAPAPTQRGTQGTKPGDLSNVKPSTMPLLVPPKNNGVTAAPMPQLTPTTKSGVKPAPMPQLTQPTNIKPKSTELIVPKKTTGNKNALTVSQTNAPKPVAETIKAPKVNTSTAQGQQAIKDGIFTNKTTGIKYDKNGNIVTGKNKYGVLTTEKPLVKNNKGQYLNADGAVMTPEELNAYWERIKALQTDFQLPTEAPSTELIVPKDGETPQSDMVLPEVNPNGVTDEELDSILSGDVPTADTEAPRDETVTATTEQPVVTMGGTAETDTGTFGGLGDTEKMTAIAMKLSKGEALSDEETKFLIEQQFSSANAAPDVSGIQEEITKQIGETQAQFEARQKEQATQRQAFLDEQKALSDKQLEAKNAQLDAAAAKEQQAAQSSLSFSGFGRSSVANDAMQEIQVKYNDQKQYYQEAADLQLELSLKELQSADAAELQPYQDRIAELQTESRKVAIDNAVTVAEMNAQQGVKGLEALTNLLQILPQSQQPKVDKETSQLLGYIADEYGNPVMTDAEGFPIPIAQEEDAVKYEMYQDSYTGQAFFYNPENPLDFYAAPGNGIGTYYNESQGTYESSPTSSSGGMQDATQFVLENFGEEAAQYGGNCALFVQSLYPDLPKGWTSVVGRKDAINKAIEAGIGGDDMTFAQVGDVIQTSEGNVGHSAIIGEIYAGEDGSPKAKLLEANYKTGEITYGREIDLNDPVILGWMRSGSNVFDEAPVPNEGNNLAIDDQVNGQYSFTPQELQQFRNYDAGKAPPTFTGRSQYEKDQKQAQWEQQYNLYSALKSSGQFNLQQYDPQGYKTQAEAFTKSDPAKSILSFSDLQSSLKNYYDLIEKYGSFEKFGEGRKLIDSAYADLKVKWKEAANLGALTGPDLGLIEDAIPEPQSGLWHGLGQKIWGGGTDAYLKTIMQTSDSTKANAKKNLGILKSLYPELIGSDIYNSYLEMSDYDLTSVDAAALDFYDNL